MDIILYSDTKGNLSFFIRVDENLPELIQRLKNYNSDKSSCKSAYLMESCTYFDVLCSCNSERLFNGWYTWRWLIIFFSITLTVIILICGAAWLIGSLAHWFIREHMKQSINQMIIK